VLVLHKFRPLGFIIVESQYAPTSADGRRSKENAEVSENQETVANDVENIVARIVGLRDGGASWTAIGEEVGLHPITCSDKYVKATTPIAKGALTPATVRRLREEGMAWHRIAAQYGTTKARVKAAFAEAEAKPASRARRARKVATGAAE
jgi:hypothetical protein